MGLLDRFTRGVSAPKVRAVEAVWVESHGDSVEVVGESFYRDALLAATGRRGNEYVRHPVVAALIREPDNAYDPNAVGVWVEGRKVGHLSVADAIEYQGALLRLGANGKVLACDALICARDGTPNLGVWLELPCADDVLQQISE